MPSEKNAPGPTKIIHKRKAAKSTPLPVGTRRSLRLLRDRALARLRILRDRPSTPPPGKKQSEVTADTRQGWSAVRKIMYHYGPPRPEHAHYSSETEREAKTVALEERAQGAENKDNDIFSPVIARQRVDPGVPGKVNEGNEGKRVNRALLEIAVHHAALTPAPSTTEIAVEGVCEEATPSQIQQIAAEYIDSMDEGSRPHSVSLKMKWFPYFRCVWDSWGEGSWTLIVRTGVAPGGAASELHVQSDRRRRLLELCN